MLAGKIQPRALFLFFHKKENEPTEQFNFSLLICDGIHHQRLKCNNFKCLSRFTFVGFF